ncbi:hypothetical protein LTR10_001276 [Elasticomyces elasticus]|nr:hypothetical protein LTR10_001276 [Elasticomyces elasticus]KAK4965357.1 hypothetical protein LTR42_012113 [Elasticomyces elasticus]
MTDTNEDSSSAPSVGQKRTAEVAFGQADPTSNENSTTNQGQLFTALFPLLTDASVIVKAPAPVNAMAGKFHWHVYMLSANLAFDKLGNVAASHYLEAHMYTTQPSTEAYEDADQLFQDLFRGLDALPPPLGADIILRWARHNAETGLKLMCASAPAKLQWAMAALIEFA